jgi:hypothetical protein
MKNEEQIMCFILPVNHMTHDVWTATGNHEHLVVREGNHHENLIAIVKSRKPGRYLVIQISI